jgi:predicted dehydrogenase
MKAVAVCSADIEKARSSATAEGIPEATNNAEALARPDDLDLC